MGDILNKNLRKRILETGYIYGHGHFGSAMSCLDIIKFLYDNIIKDNDIFILSKGHGILALQVVLEEKGINVNWELMHPEWDEEHGISATTGSLGHGLAIAVGRAFAKKVKNDKGRIYCLLGDGEMQEGSIWEALNIAHRFKLTNLIILIDWNKYQALDSIKEIMNEDKGTLTSKLFAFGYNVWNIDGHDNQKFEFIFEQLKYATNKFNVIILDTVKGYGIPFLEKNPSFHVLYLKDKPEIFEESMKYLEWD